MGKDELYGDEGSDRIKRGEDLNSNAFPWKGDRRKDTVTCGPGDDTVTYEKGIDNVAKKCETRRHYR